MSKEIVCMLTLILLLRNDLMSYTYHCCLRLNKGPQSMIPWWINFSTEIKPHSSKTLLVNQLYYRILTDLFGSLKIFIRFYHFITGSLESYGRRTDEALSSIPVTTEKQRFRVGEKDLESRFKRKRHMELVHKRGRVTT